MSYNKKDYIRTKINSYYKNKFKKKKIMKNLKHNAICETKQGGFSKIYINIKGRIYKTFIDNELIFDISYDDIIGCNKEYLEKYIKDLLLDGMNIDNYGEWEIDHIIPVSSFDFTKRENILTCFNYKNLQPLWWLDNRKKYNKILN